MTLPNGWILDEFDSPIDGKPCVAILVNKSANVKTGNMINPHNPDFITKRPWYLGSSDAGPSLDHQTVDKDAKDRVLLSMSSADQLVKEERRTLKEKQKNKENKI